MFHDPSANFPIRRCHERVDDAGGGAPRGIQQFDHAGKNAVVISGFVLDPFAGFLLVTRFAHKKSFRTRSFLPDQDQFGEPFGLFFSAFRCLSDNGSQPAYRPRSCGPGARRQTRGDPQPFADSGHYVFRTRGALAQSGEVVPGGSLRLCRRHREGPNHTAAAPARMGLILDTSVVIADERGKFDMPGFL
jgi:hypothetical protein